MAKRPSNEKFVKDLMRFSEYGALSQIFVVEALTKWSALIAKEDPSKFDSPLMNGEAWVGVAKEIKAKIEANYGVA